MERFMTMILTQAAAATGDTILIAAVSAIIGVVLGIIMLKLRRR